MVSILRKSLQEYRNTGAATLAQLKHKAPWLLLVLGGVAQVPAQAALSDSFHPFVGVGYNYDDNLFRLPDAVAGDASQRSDRSRNVFAGLQFEHVYGRQAFEVSAQTSQVSFDRYSALNYNAKDLSGAWRWQLGNHLEGQLGGTYVESLSSYTDFHATVRNLRTQTGAYFEAKYRFHPSWQVRGRAQKDKLDFDLSSQSYLDRRTNTSEVGVDYLVNTGSTIGLLGRHVQAEYPHPLLLGNSVFNQAYQQDELKLKVLWKFSAVSQVQFVGGRARRNFDQATLSDSSGADFRVIGDWVPASSIKLTANLWKEYAPFEGRVISYSRDTGASVDGNWDIKSSLRLTGQVRRLNRDLYGVTSSSLRAGADDRITRSSLGVMYAPRPTVQVNATAYREVRSTNTNISSSFRANGLSLSAYLQF